MKKILAILALILLFTACMSVYPLKVEKYKEPVKYPHEITLIENTEYMTNAEFTAYVYDYLKTSKFWQSKIIIEVMFREVERMEQDKVLFSAYVFWRNK